MKVKLTVEFEIDKSGNLLGLIFDAKFCRGGPFLKPQMLNPHHQKLCSRLMKATFDLNRMKKKSNG